MSEEMNVQRGGFRKQLLATVSALALVGSAYVAQAADNDGDRPQVWIELGGQLDRLSGTPQIFSPQFFSLASPANLSPLVDSQRPAPFSIGEEGKITFEPEGSDWLFSASIRYGRSSSGGHFHHQTQIPTIHGTFRGKYQPFTSAENPAIFVDGQTSTHETHAVLDFQAGKDIGLGLFGGHGDSTLSVGVRFAQFTSSNNNLIHARPFVSHYMISKPGKYKRPVFEHGMYTAVLQAKRDTHAFGPSISWDASAPVVGNTANATLSLDWGVNAAVLFGRQRAHAHHQTTGYYFKGARGYKASGGGPKYSRTYQNTPPDQNRSRFVTIPNVGGFAGISFRYADAKVCFGYRGDFFFGAMDGGIDTRKSTTLGFYGPFASVSVGLGG